METILIMLAITATFIVMGYLFLKEEYGVLVLDEENIEKAKKIFAKTIDRLQIKKIISLSLGEIFKFIQELPNSAARATWNIRKELMLIMIIGIIFYSFHLAGFTYTPYVIVGVIVFVIFGLRKSGHLKNSDSEKEQEKTEVPNYENMDDIQIGVDMAKRFIKNLYEISIGATVKFLNKVITREGRANLLLEQEIILAALITIPYVYFGWIAFKITLIYIAGNYLVEILRGKVETPEELKSKIKKLETEIAEIEVNILNINVSGKAADVKKALSNLQNKIKA